MQNEETVMADEQKKPNNSSKIPAASDSTKASRSLKPNKEEHDDFSGLDERFGQRNKNEYYGKVSNGYRRVKLVLVVILVLAVLFAIVIASDDLTYSNIRYMLRNFTEITTEDTVRAELVKFDAETNTVCEIFAGKIAVASEEGISLYRPSGKKIFSESIIVYEPRLTAGDKYFFVWSSGENLLYIFNSVSLVREESFDHPIYSVVCGLDGSFAVLTEDAGVTSSVLVYNKNFQCILKKQVDSGYVSSIALSGDGRLLASAAFSTDNGRYITKLENISLSDGSVVFEAVHENAFPLEVGFFENSGHYFVSNSSVFVYSDSGELIYSDDTVSSVRRAHASQTHLSYLVSSVSVSKQSEVKVVSQNGDLTADVALEGTVSDIALTDYSLLLLSNNVVVVSLEDGGRTELTKKPNALSLFADGLNVYCLFPDRAELIIKDGEPITSND